MDSNLHAMFAGNEESDTRMVSSKENVLLLDYKTNILVLLHSISNPPISQIPIYHEIQDATEEEQQQYKESRVETITTTDSFYDLLQAVH